MPRSLLPFSIEDHTSWVADIPSLRDYGRAIDGERGKLMVYDSHCGHSYYRSACLHVLAFDLSTFGAKSRLQLLLEEVSLLRAKPSLGYQTRPGGFFGEVECQRRLGLSQILLPALRSQATSSLDCCSCTGSLPDSLVGCLRNLATRLSRNLVCNAQLEPFGAACWEKTRAASDIAI
jgi:hypothetical protein